MKKLLKKILPQKDKLPLETIAKIGAERVKSVNKLSDIEIKKRMIRINDDFNHAFKLLRRYPDTVTFFGSSQIDRNNKYYKQARHMAKLIVERLHLTIVSGGGPGIMEAGNRGARDAHGESVGMTIAIPQEQVNGYVTHSADFYYFFSRKVAMTFTSRAYVFFPGGFGTLDELFEILTLQKTGKIPDIPVILVGSEFWKPLDDFLNNIVYKKLGGIDKKNMTLYEIVDDPQEIISIIAGKPKEKL